MTKTTVLAAVLLIGATASGIGAATGNRLQGSDTLGDFTRTIIPGCAGAESLIYVGGGSGTAESGMIVGSQEVGPMSRFFNSNACKGATPMQAQGHTVAFDGIALSTNASNTQCASGGLAFSGGFDVTTAAGAPALNCPGCDPGTNHYTLKGPTGAASDAWKDVLRLIYSGIDHTGSAITNQNCSSDVRRSLADNYGALFQGGCSTGTCTQLTHAFRRDDLSGTTDTVISVLGLPAITSTPNPFCNGDEQSDKDPIRRACSPDDDVCNKDGKLGLVLPILAPPNVPLGTPLYNNVACSATNKLKLLPCQKTVSAGGAATFQCPDRPDGDGFNIAGGTLTPVTDAGAPCMCDTASTRCKSIFTKPTSTDHRVFNLYARTAAGALVQNTPPDATDPNAKKRTFQETHAFYRLRSSSVNNGKAAGSLCTSADDTVNIGCLDANESCTVGYSGLESLKGGAAGLLVNNVAPVPANVLSASYPLSRKLFLDSLVGFANVQNSAEKALASTATGCYGNVATVQSVANSLGFVALPAGTTAEECVDFDETTCNTAVIACKVNSDCGVSAGACLNASKAACTTETNCTCVASCTSDADCKGGRTCDTAASQCKFLSPNSNSCATSP